MHLSHIRRFPFYVEPAEAVVGAWEVPITTIVRVVACNPRLRFFMPAEGDSGKLESGNLCTIIK
jgi:hypothetical protein